MALQGRTAVVTGAASGIGRAVAQSLARRGVNLALADLNEAGLAETARSMNDAVRISRHRLDVANRDAVAAFPNQVLEDHPGVDILVNNAGVALAGRFEQTSEADFEWLFNINFWGVVRMTRAFLPLLRASAEAHLVNVSSIYGIIAPPGQTHYAASKFAVRGFTAALRQELAGSAIAVTTVHPGGVATAIARSARLAQSITPEEAARGQRQAARMLRLPPERAGEIIVRAIERKAPRVMVGRDAQIISLLERLAPIGHMRIALRNMGRGAKAPAASD